MGYTTACTPIRHLDSSKLSEDVYLFVRDLLSSRGPFRNARCAGFQRSRRGPWTPCRPENLTSAFLAAGQELERDGVPRGSPLLGCPTPVIFLTVQKIMRSAFRP